MKTLSLIIVTYNSQKDIYACLNSVFQYNDIGDELEVIVVDNNSSDVDELELKISTLFPSVVFIRNTKNGGYGQGNNVGIRSSHAPFICIMNPDIRLIMPTFRVFVETLSQKNIVMCSGKQFCDPTTPNASFYYDFHVSGFLQTFGRIWRHKLDLYNYKKMWLQGAFFAIRKYEFEQIGLFDEDIFMYAEEYDIHLRLLRSFPYLHGKYLPKIKYLHLTKERTINKPTIQKQHESNILVCQKRNISLNKYYREQRIAAFCNSILSTIFGHTNNC